MIFTPLLIHITVVIWGCVSTLSLATPRLPIFNEYNYASTNSHIFTNATEPQHDCHLSSSDSQIHEELGVKAGELIEALGIPAFALITQCNTRLARTVGVSVVDEAGRRGISACVFQDLATLSAAVMTHPHLANCFGRRQWTVVLLGSVTWAAVTIANANTSGIYDQRVHWVVLGLGTPTSVTSTLHFFTLTHRITWLRWSTRTQGWVVLVSDAIEGRVVAMEGGRWIVSGGDGDGDSGDGDIPSRLFKHRPLTPPYTTNFFSKTLRVVSRYATNKTLQANSVGRCYYTRDGRTDCTGYVGRMLMLLTNALNLTIINKAVHQCGVANSNGTRVDVIQKQDADIALGTCSITANRLQVVSFTEFIIVIRSSIAGRQPGVMQSAFLILNVFSWDTWTYLCVLVVMMALVIWFINNLLAKVSPDLYTPLSNAFAIPIKAFLFQSHAHQPLSWSGRGVVAFGWVVIVTVVGVYSGNLTAWLSLPRYEKPVDSLSDLVKRPDLIPVATENDPNHIMFANRTSGILGIIGKRLKFRDLLYPRNHMKEMTKDIRDGKVVYFNSDRSHLAKATALNVAEGIEGFAECRIHLATEDIRQDYIGLMINKNSWFKEQMNYLIRWLRSYGVILHLYRQFNPPGCRLQRSKTFIRGSRALTLTHLQGGIWVWLAGMAVSCIFLMAELIYHRSFENPIFSM